MSDLNRIKKNIQKRDWSAKSDKQNINYIKRQLKSFGLNIPKYLTKNAKLTTQQIRNQTRRIINEIENQQQYNRIHGENITMNQALKRLEKTINKHNQRVFKQLQWVETEYRLSENRINYLLGKEVEVKSYRRDKDTRSNIEFIDSPFATYSLDNMYFSDTNAVNEMIKTINNKTNKLTKDEIRKFLKRDKFAISELSKALKNYSDSGYMDINESKQFLHAIKQLGGIQQKAFYSMWSATTPKIKYETNKEDEEELQANLLYKWKEILRMSKNF